MTSYGLARDLERRFDGDIPDDLRVAARAGGQATFVQTSARSNSRCCDSLALSATRATAMRRSDGDTGHWRQEGLHWHLEASDSSRI